jgi:GT2 family glycosyltransferase
MIDIALATKWRVDKLTRTIQAFVDNTDDLGTICVTYDSDDAETHAARDDILKKFPDKVSFDVCNIPGSCTRAMNKSIEKTKTKYIGLFGDDTIVRTKGWDTLSMNLFAKNTEYQCLSFCTKPGADLRKVFGIFYYPAFCVMERSSLIKIGGGFDERYIRCAGDKQLAIDMLLNDMLMMVCDDIVMEHIRDGDTDRLFQHTKGLRHKDESLFRKIWEPKTKMLKNKYSSVKDKWGILLKSKEQI